MFIFNSRFNTLRVTLRPSKRLVIGTQVVKEDGLTAVFDHGIFTTEDEETAQLLREKIKKTNDHNIVEIGDVEDRAFRLLKKKDKNVRNMVTAAEISKMDPKPAPRVEERDQALKCPICDKVFTKQRGLNIHLVSHRPDVQVSHPEVSPADALETKTQEAPAESEA